MEEEKKTMVLEIDPVKMTDFINDVQKLYDKYDISAGEMVFAFSVLTGKHFAWSEEENGENEER